MIAVANGAGRATGPPAVHSGSSQHAALQGWTHVLGQSPGSAGVLVILLAGGGAVLLQLW